MKEVTLKCNRCSKDGYELWNPDSEGVYLHELITEAGYGSDYDNEEINIHLCDKCLSEVLKDFKFNPLNNLN